MRGVAVAVVLTLALAGTALAHSSTVRVLPSRGSPSAHFVVSFLAPRATGTSTGTFSRYVVRASGPAGSRCASSTQVVVAPTRAGQRVAVSLVPPGRVRAWCPGRYTGTVSQTVRPECGGHELCPMFIAWLVVGRFTFRVT